MEVRIYLNKIRHNVNVIREICRHADMQPVWMTKGCQAHPGIVDILSDATEDVIGDVRIRNLERIRRRFSGKLMMSQLPGAEQAANIVEYADIILITSPAHAEALSAAALTKGRNPALVLMVDVGNCREGVLLPLAGELVDKISALPGVHLTGIGTTVGCYGGFKASVSDLELLIRITEAIEADTGHRFQVVSAGSGTMLLELARKGKIPERVNQFRIGAAVWVGEMPPTKTPIQGLHQDAFLFVGEVLDISLKLSPDLGKTGEDAFGHRIQFPFTGPRRLALMNFGMIDTDPYALYPLDPGVRIIGATSNYTICDFTDCNLSLGIGDRLEFRMAYSAVARAMSSSETVVTEID